MFTSMFASGRIARVAVRTLLIPTLPATVLWAGMATAQTAAGGDAQPPTPSASLTGTAHIHHDHRRHRVATRKAAIVAQPPRPMPVAANGTSPAPVPNEAVLPPDQPAPVSEIAPSVFQLHYPPVGEGYVTGSSPQAMDDRNAAKATGVQLKVPLPQ